MPYKIWQKELCQQGKDDMAALCPESRKWEGSPGSQPGGACSQPQGMSLG